MRKKEREGRYLRLDRQALNREREKEREKERDIYSTVSNIIQLYIHIYIYYIVPVFYSLKDVFIISLCFLCICLFIIESVKDDR